MQYEVGSAALAQERSVTVPAAVLDYPEAVSVLQEELGIQARLAESGGQELATVLGVAESVLQHKASCTSEAHSLRIILCTELISRLLQAFPIFSIVPLNTNLTARWTSPLTIFTQLVAEPIEQSITGLAGLTD